MNLHKGFEDFFSHPDFPLLIDRLYTLSDKFRLDAEAKIRTGDNLGEAKYALGKSDGVNIVAQHLENSRKAALSNAD